MGLIAGASRGLSILAGEQAAPSPDRTTAIEQLVARFEESWKGPAANIDASALPSLDDFRDGVEDVCTELRVSRIVVLIDKASTFFCPNSSASFLRYSGICARHISVAKPPCTRRHLIRRYVSAVSRATMLSLDRDIMAADYVDTMREIVEKQAESGTLEDIAKHDKNFALLAFSASGNPRVLLKTLARAPRVTAAQTNEVVRECYRSDLWSEHSTLPEKYSGHNT